MRQLKAYGGDKDRYTQQNFWGRDTGYRRSHGKVINLLDTEDPAWPSIAALLREMADAKIELDEASVSMAIKLGTHRHHLAMRYAPKASPGRGAASYQATLDGTSTSIVYYIRRGALIKIGTTARPTARFKNLLPDEILAFEPGDVTRESMRHQQFDHLRERGEWFRPAPELLEHARQLRTLHGAPDPSWPSIAAMLKGRRVRDPLPPLTSTETLTVTEAEARFRLKKHTVYSWARSGHISPAGTDDWGRLVFYAEHVAAVRDRTAHRRREKTTAL